MFSVAGIVGHSHTHAFIDPKRGSIFSSLPGGRQTQLRPRSNSTPGSLPSPKGRLGCEVALRRLFYSLIERQFLCSGPHHENN
jgi:hypothetical protein